MSKAFFPFAGFGLVIFLLLAAPAQSSDQAKTRTATFAGGCFWCMEPPFESLKGVLSVVSGYTGGTGPDPTYGDYARKGHIEAVEVTYDPALVSYARCSTSFGGRSTRPIRGANSAIGGPSTVRPSSPRR